MTRPILYSFRRCPYAMRARMAIWTSGAAVELREVLLRDKPEEMVRASPKGTVPVLALEGGEVLDESLSVMLWALGGSDPEAWLSDDATQAEMLTLIAENDGPFKHHLDRYKYASRYEDADPEEHRAGGAAFLERLEGRLSDGQLFGAKPKLADIAIFPFVRQFRIADPEWFDAAPYPHLRAWLDGHMTSDLFASVMEKYAVWRSGEPGIAFGRG